MSGNFDKLNSDEKIMILMKLSSKEILKTCSINKDLARVCGDVRYNPLWYQKIRDDFNITYNEKNKFSKNGYEEYKRLYLLYKTCIYTVDVYDADNYKKFSYNFLTREDAEMYVYSIFSEDLYPKIFISLKHTSGFSSDDITCNISFSNITKKRKTEEVKTKLKNIEHIYENKTLVFYNLFSNLKNKNRIILDFKFVIDLLFEDFLKLNTDKDDFMNDDIPKEVEYLVKKYNLQEYEKEIRDYMNYLF